MHYISVLNQSAMLIQAPNYHIRAAQPDEIESVFIDWAAREGWNPGLNDAGSFYRADKNGFLIGSLGNEPVSCISVVKYHPGFAFLGFYIVKPQMRGKGLGLKIWNAAIEYAADANVGLDGVIDQQDNYKKSGFRLAYRNIRYYGKSFKTDSFNPGILPFADGDLKQLLAYDASLFPVDRKSFTESWVTHPAHLAGIARAGHSLNGYCVIRPCRNGYKIGPLFADSPDAADALLRQALNRIPAGSDYYIDIPEPNTNSPHMINSLKLTPVFETARMYTQKNPLIDITKIFGVTTFELG